MILRLVNMKEKQATARRLAGIRGEGKE